MPDPDALDLGPARGVHVEKQGDEWTLVLERTLKHPPATVWKALVDPAQLKHWAPFDADRPLDTAGAQVHLTTVGAPATLMAITTVRRAEAPQVLEFDWGGRLVRWNLDPAGSGTRLTLWATIDRRYIAMGAAGWHLCLAVLEKLLDQDPVGRQVGPDALKLAGWQRLNQEYAKQFEGE